jgi:hypothetical protein
LFDRKSTGCVAVIPDARKASDKESRAKPTLFCPWIPDRAFGPSGMTRANAKNKKKKKKE